MTESAADRFRRILDDGLCIGCGLCKAVIGSENIQMHVDDLGELRPRVLEPLEPGAVDLIYDICPGTRVEGLPPDRAAVAAHRDLVWGPYERLALAWASDATVRHVGSTAGVLTALGQFLIRSCRVAFVMHVRPSTENPTFGEATLSFSEAEVLAASGSRYGPAAPLALLESALALGKPFAVIAKPCDLNALRNLAHHDGRIEQLVKYWLSPVCGGFLPTTAMDRFLAGQGLSRRDVKALRYRGHGCPGPTRIDTLDGGVLEFHYLDFWGEDESAWILPFRCKICPDGIGEAADIAVADTWENGSPDRWESRTDPGTNSVILRTQSGATLFDAAVDAGALVRGRCVDVGFLNRTQPHQVRKKMFAHARFEGLRAAGSLVPVDIGLRLADLAMENLEEENDRERRGAFERARKAGDLGPIGNRGRDAGR